MFLFNNKCYESTKRLCFGTKTTCCLYIFIYDEAISVGDIRIQFACLGIVFYCSVNCAVVCDLCVLLDYVILASVSGNGFLRRVRSDWNELNWTQFVCFTKWTELNWHTVVQFTVYSPCNATELQKQIHANYKPKPQFFLQNQTHDDSEPKAMVILMWNLS